MEDGLRKTNQESQVDDLNIDGTDRQRLERLNQEQKAILSSFYNSSPFMMGIVELSDRDILHICDNVATATFFQTTPEAMAEKWSSELGVLSENIQLWLTHYRASQEQLQPVQFEYAHKRQTETYWLSVTVLFIGIADSQRPRFSYVAEDISDHQQAEAALRDSEARWQFAIEGAGDGLWDWNTQTNIVFYSRQWKEMFGYTEEEIGNGLDEWESRIHPDDIAQCYADLNKHFHDKTPIYQNEHRVRCKDGSYKWILDRGKVVAWTDDDQPLRVIGTHTDISDRKRAESALSESEARW